MACAICLPLTRKTVNQAKKRDWRGRHIGWNASAIRKTLASRRCFVHLTNNNKVKIPVNKKDASV
jgi:hypothetical protein